jgi:threonine/homoserine/homoserine lactone efflux protein
VRYESNPSRILYWFSSAIQVIAVASETTNLSLFNMTIGVALLGAGIFAVERQ